MTGEPDDFSPLRWQDDKLALLDQTRLPHEETWLVCDTPDQVADAPKRFTERQP